MTLPGRARQPGRMQGRPYRVFPEPAAANPSLIRQPTGSSVSPPSAKGRETRRHEPARHLRKRILALLHDAVLDDARWPATSALIDEACGMTGNAC